MRKLFSIVLSATILATSIAPVSAEFSDVFDGYIYKDAINYLEAEGIAQGKSDGRFGITDTITRAEFTKIIIGANFSEAEIDSCIADNGYDGNNIFPDIASDHLFATWICVAKENGVMSGGSDGNFKPDNSISVGESLKVVSNTYGLTDVQSGPEGDIFQPFADALAAVNAIPTTVGLLDSELERGEMAAYVYRLDNGITDKESKSYSDLKLNEDTSNWTEYTIEEFQMKFSVPSDWTLVEDTSAQRYDFYFQGENVLQIGPGGGSSTCEGGGADYDSFEINGLGEYREWMCKDQNNNYNLYIAVFDYPDYETGPFSLVQLYSKGETFEVDINDRIGTLQTIARSIEKY